MLLIWGLSRAGGAPLNGTALLPFSGPETYAHDPLRTTREIPRFLSEHCLNDSIGLIPFDRVLSVLPAAPDELTLSQLSDLAQALDVRVLITGIIDTFAMQAFGPRPHLNLPHARVTCRVRLRFFDADQNGWCQGEKLVKGEGFRTRHASEQPDPGIAPALSDLGPDDLMADAFRKAMAQLTERFYTETGDMLCRIYGMGSICRSIHAGDVPRVFDIQDGLVYIYGKYASWFKKNAVWETEAGNGTVCRISIRGGWIQSYHVGEILAGDTLSLMLRPLRKAVDTTSKPGERK